MQMSFIVGFSPCRVSTPQASTTAEVPKDETPLATQRQLHPEGSDTANCEDESEFDHSLELRAVRSSALSNRTTNLIDGELSRSPSFKEYLKNDSKLDLNEDSNLNENRVLRPGYKQTIKDLLGKTDADFQSPLSFQPIDTSKPLLSNKKLGLGPGPRKKEKGWKFRFRTKKNKDSRNKAPHQLLSQETAAVMIQKVIRGFLLRKHLKILRNIDAIGEDFGKQLGKYGEILVSDSLQNKIKHMLSQLNKVRVAMVYKRKVLQKIILLQKTVHSIASRTRKFDSDTIVEKSDVVMDSDKLIMESFIFPKLQLERVVETEGSVEKAPSDSTYSIRVCDNNKINENIDWDPFEDDDIVIDFHIPTTQNSLEENKRVESVNLMEESAVDGQETEGARENRTMKKVNLDSIEVQNEFDPMLEREKLKKQPKSFDQKDDASSTEIEEVGKTSNTDSKFIENELNSNDPAMETMDEVCDEIKCKMLLNNVQKLKRNKEFDDNVLESSQLVRCCNQTQEKYIKGLIELSAESNEMKTLMKELQNSVQELENKLQRIERKEN
ncbi:uncharacterized protein LOC144554573 [Carex rostrata]